MKSSYYDILDKHWTGFCGSGDEVEVLDEDNKVVKGVVRACSLTCIKVEDTSEVVRSIQRVKVTKISHCIKEKNHVPVELNDLISFPMGDDKDLRCLGVIQRLNPPYASIRVLSGPDASEVVNVWQKLLYFIVKGFSLKLFDELEEQEMNLSYKSLSECLNLNIPDQVISLSEIFNPLINRAKLYTNPLYRRDVSSNDKIKKWGKGMLRKTKVIGTLLSPQIAEADTGERGSSMSCDTIDRNKNRTPGSGRPSSNSMIPIREVDSPVENYKDRADESSDEFSSSPLIFIEKPKSSSYDSLIEEEAKPKSKSGNFLSKLFGAQKKPKEGGSKLKKRSSGRERRSSTKSRENEEEGPSSWTPAFPEVRRSSDDEQAGAICRRSSEREKREDDSDLEVHHHSHKLIYRSYSDDWNSSSSGTKLLDIGGYSPGCYSDYPIVGENDKTTELVADNSSDSVFDSEKRVWLNVNASTIQHNHTVHPHMYTAARWNIPHSKPYASPPPASPMSPVHSGVSSSSTSEASDIEKMKAPDFDLFSEITVGDSAVGGQPLMNPSSQFDFDTFVKDAKRDSSNAATSVEDDLVDLRNIGIPYTPPSQIAPSPTERLSLPLIPTSPSQVSTSSQDDDDFLPVVKRNRVLHVGKGIGFRNIPPFRKRVVFLPPLPIATNPKSSDLENEKQVRFFTNVICHEYKSY